MSGRKKSARSEEKDKVKANIAIVYYSMYGHVKQMADAVKEGVASTGAEVFLFQVPETLSGEVLEKLGAPKRPDDCIIATAEVLDTYDGVIFGMPTRFGMAAAQMKAFMDTTGGMWQNQSLSKKTAGLFFSTGTQGGGQESTALTFLTQLTHHGMIYIPLGYTHESVGQMDEIMGGSPYGPGTYAAADGSRQPSELEKEIAKSYGKRFATITTALLRGSKKHW